MCKIMVMSGINERTTELAWKFIHIMAQEMSSYTERDGMGYAAVDADGNLFGERWLNNGDAFKERLCLSPLEQKLLKDYDGLLAKPRVYNSFGPLENANSIRSITLHSRAATAGKEFYNTHPFVDKNSQTSVIHNGVIRNAEKIGMYISTCDSEAILNSYLVHGVQDNPEKIKEVAKDLEGYYACGMFSKRSVDGRVILDVFKDNTATLHAAYIAELETIVFTTSLDQIKAACRKLDLSIITEFGVKAGCLVRMDAITGEVLSKTKFDSAAKRSGNNKGGKGGKGKGHVTGVVDGKEEITDSHHIDTSYGGYYGRGSDTMNGKETVKGSHGTDFALSGRINGISKEIQEFREKHPLLETPEVIHSNVAPKLTTGEIDNNWHQVEPGVWKRIYRSFTGGR